MKISELSIQELYTIVNGDNMPSLYRKGKDLVMLFNKYGGYREICDEKGLPSINKANGQRPSRKEFTIHHLRELNGTDALRVILFKFRKFNLRLTDCKIYRYEPFCQTRL